MSTEILEIFQSSGQEILGCMFKVFIFVTLCTLVYIIIGILIYVAFAHGNEKSYAQSTLPTALTLYWPVVAPILLLVRLIKKVYRMVSKWVNRRKTMKELSGKLDVDIL